MALVAVIMSAALTFESECEMCLRRLVPASHRQRSSGPDAQYDQQSDRYDEHQGDRPLDVVPRAFHRALKGVDARFQGAVSRVTHARLRRFGSPLRCGGVAPTLSRGWVTMESAAVHPRRVKRTVDRRGEGSALSVRALSSGTGKRHQDQPNVPRIRDLPGESEMSGFLARYEHHLDVFGRLGM